MTPAQIYSLIEANGCTTIQLKDYSGNKLHDIEEATSPAAVISLERALPNFSGYRKISVLAKKGGASTPWTKGCSWQLEFAGEENKPVAAAAGHADGRIGATEYLTMMKDMMSENYKLQLQVVEKSLALSNNDPSKWIGVFNAVAPSLGLKVGGIAGPPSAGQPTKELHLHDVDTSTMSEEQVSEMIGEKLLSISKKISGSEMLKIITRLDENKNLPSQTDKIAQLLNTINNKPELLEMAMKFI